MGPVETPPEGGASDLRTDRHGATMAHGEYGDLGHRHAGGVSLSSTSSRNLQLLASPAGTRVIP